MIAPLGLAGGWRYACLIELASALAQAGEAAAARAVVPEMEAARHAGIAILDPDAILARAWVAAAEGALGEAVRVAHESANAARTMGLLAKEVVALHIAVCLGDPNPAERLAELAAVVDGPRAPAAAAHAAAWAAGDAAGLLAASERFERMGDLLSALDAAAQAGTVHAGEGRRASARALTERARRLAAGCEGAWTPALAVLVAPVALTGREREVVTLAATGLSNREIAARLDVSVRTVEGHVYRAAARLGVSDRADLGAAIRGGWKSE